MPNILKYLYLLILILNLSTANGQELILSSLNLNAGGVINDVAYDKHNNVYIVVGDFTTINGFGVHNIAFINADDYTVNTSANYNIISAINGPIYSVAFCDTLPLILPLYHDYFLFIGGEFDAITIGGATSTRKGIAKLKYHHSGSFSPMVSPYLLDTWDADLGDAFGHIIPVVNAIEIWKDTVIIVGDFNAAKASTTYDARFSCASFNLYHGGILAYPAFAMPGGPIGPYMFNTFLRDGNTSYVAGRTTYGSNTARCFKLDVTGGALAFTAPTGGRNEYYFPFSLNDSLISVGVDFGALDNRMSEIRVLRKSNGTEKVDHEIPLGHAYAAQADSYDIYKKTVFQTQSDVGYYLDSYEIIDGSPVMTPNWNGTSNLLNTDAQSGVDVVNNVLFVSANNLSTAGGSSRGGLALFCLEPSNIQYFTLFDTTICQSDTITYAVEQVNFADGYMWEYTGTGVDIGITGAPENLSDTLFGAGAWSVDIRFTNEFTPGNLLVTPFSRCNETIPLGVYLTSNTISIPLTTNPLPNALAGDDVTLTCVTTETSLVGDSDSTEVSFSWNTLGGDPLYDSPGAEYLVGEAGTYILTVKNELGCLNFDTLTVDLDTIRPNFDPILGPFDLTCSDTMRSYLGFCNNLTDTTSFWVKLASHDTVSNPISVNLPGQYQFYTINNVNGCMDSLGPPIIVYLNQPSPNIEIYGYEELPVATPLDTINCYFPSLTIQCYSDTASTILNWVEADSTDPSGDIITITEGGNYYILAQNMDNGCFNYTGVNIAADFAKPNVILPVVSSLNCSNDSLLLNGGTIFLDTIIEWTGDLIAPSPNPLTVFEAGTYYLSVTKNDNGCVEIDSLEIIADNSIDVFLGYDTLICDESLLYLTVSYGGTIGGITYLWDNGTTDANAFYTGGTDAYASVEVFGDDGCYGIDTLLISIPPVPVIDFVGYQPCGDGATGSIIAAPMSGFAPFEYSIDEGSSFQTTPVLTGLDFGTYTIWVKDSLDCLYNFEATIDESSALPTPQFLFSTYNFQFDTVIVVDVSNPPADSVVWQFSEELEYIGDLDGSPLVILPDTGSFLITMNAYYGECLVSVTKEVFVSEFDSTYATFNNQNGIQSINLYPNPTTGSFTLEVEFYKKQRVSIAIQDMIGYSYDERVLDEIDSLEESFDLDYDAVNGTYVVRIISEYDSAYITFVLSR